MLDKITHLFRLQAIIEEGSLHRASKRLSVTQPALSRSLSQLESHFGKPLVERHARGVRATPFGDRVMAASMRLMRQWELTEQDLSTEDTLQNVTLRIGAGPVWRTIILPQVMLDMQARFPGVTFEITRAHPTDTMSDLTTGKLDVALFAMGQTGSFPRLVEHPMAVIQNRIVARAGHPILESVDASGHIPARRLLDFPWLVYQEYATYYRQVTIHSVFEKLGRNPDIRLVCDSLHTTLTTLQRSDYLSFLPEPITAAAERPRLVPLPLDLQKREIEIGFVLREELAEWEPVRNLRDICAEVLADLPFTLNRKTRTTF